MSRCKRKVYNLLELQNYRCFYCGINFTSFSRRNGYNYPTADHVIARYANGSDNESNLVVACNLCNSTKHHMDIEHFCYLISCDDTEFNKFIQKKYVSRVRKKKLADAHIKKTPWEINLKRIRTLRKKHVNDSFL